MLLATYQGGMHKAQPLLNSTLVLLTLNEIEGIKALFDQIPFDKVHECFAVDGGSTDGSVEYFENKGIRVITQERKGRGEAFRIAAEQARGDHLVFFSMDGNEDPADITKLLDLLDAGFDMAIASRFMPDSRNEEDEKLFPIRKWANLFFSRIARFLWGGNITDTINGFRAIKKTAFKQMKPDAQGFMIEFQMSIRAMKLGFKVAEIPTIEGNRIGGESTAKSISTGMKALRLLWREFK